MKKTTLVLPVDSAYTTPACNGSSIEIRLRCTASSSHSGSDAVTKLNSVSALGMKLRQKLQNIERDIHDTAPPLTLNGDGSIDCPTVLTTSSDCSSAVAPEASTTDRVKDFLAMSVYAAECLAVGDQSALLAASNVRATRAKILPAKSTQTMSAQMGNDGNIYVTKASAREITKKHMTFLTAAAGVNALGMTVEVIIGKERYRFPALRNGATKITWLMVCTRKIIAPVTGFFRTAGSAEVIIDGKAKPLKVADHDACMLIEADRAEAAVEMVVEVFQASNPFLGDEENYRILEVLRITEAGKQEQLPLNP